MALSSMTGFARSQGVCGAYAWGWEIKSVNAKGLDTRLRLPPGWDAVDAPVRARIAAALSRGTVNASLSIERQGGMPGVRINEAVLNAVVQALAAVSGRIEAAPPRLDGILGIRGVVEVVEDEDTADTRAAVEAAAVAGFNDALEGLVAMRRHEGAALEKVLMERLAQIADLVAAAEANPGRRPEAIKARLQEQVAVLLESSDRFDADRLHQEAIVLATKGDIREELDRLNAHVEQARKLIAGGGAVGRRLDFLSQEFNREANTVCSKSNDIALTNTGLELKSVVEQFREQVQNLE